MYNLDETSCCTNKIVVHGRKSFFSSEESMVGGYTTCCTCNAAVQSLPPFTILPLNCSCNATSWHHHRDGCHLKYLLYGHIVIRCSAPKNIYGDSIKDYPCFLFLDGHKSRQNSIDIENFFIKIALKLYRRIQAISLNLLMWHLLYHLSNT